jgi:hypothetical protein
MNPILNDFNTENVPYPVNADDEVKTLSKFAILDPTTGQYHFRDEKVGDEKIQDVILNKLKDVEVDTDKIKEYLINLDFEINSQKMTDLRNIYKVWSSFGIGNNNITKGLIKYLL